LSVVTVSSTTRRPAARVVHVQADGGKKKLAVFVSGGGSNFKAIHAKCLDGTINGEVVLVVSNAPSCGGCEYARGHGIPVAQYPVSKKSGKGITADALVERCQEAGADYVLLAGYLKMIPEQLVKAYKGAMLNIHPALLPSFGGHGMFGGNVHKAVVAKGVRFSGPTVHFVDEEYDTGAIIAQRAVPVYPTDTPDDVAARVLKEEWVVYPWVVEALCDGRIEYREGDRMPMVHAKEGDHQFL